MVDMGLYVDIRKRLKDFELSVKIETDYNVTAILGASGSGKSLTLKCLAGIEHPDEGVIRFNGETWFDSEAKINVPSRKRKLGYLFQDYALFPHMTVLENIEIQSVKKLDDAYFRRFHVSELLDKYPAQLSGGEKQRVAMARMIATEPKLILLDEPFSALDSHLKFEIENEIEEILRDYSAKTLFVSHDRDEVYRLCDGVSTIVNGRLEDVYELKDFFQNPRTKAAAVLSGCKNITDAVRKNENTIYLPKWNVELTTRKKIDFDEGFVGIRAHAISPMDATASSVNVFEADEYKVTEELFEWNVFFKRKSALEYVLWRVSKDIWKYGVDELPRYFTIHEDGILLFRE